jgi:hypothetical protein
MFQCGYPDKALVQQLLAKSWAGYCNNGQKAKLGGGFSWALNIDH